MALPSLILIAANLVPIVGVVYWGWDAFVLLMLYWSETAVIAFWTIIRVATEPAANGVHAAVGVIAGLALAAFFTVHAGIFMTVHFVFLWSLFAGAWRAQIHGVDGFIRIMIFGTGLWLPLLILFLVRGRTVLWPLIGPRLGFAPASPEPADPGRGYISGLYVRIVIMQVTIIAGAWFALTLAPGSIAPLILLILIKTGIDLALGPVAERLRLAKATVQPGAGD